MRTVKGLLILVLCFAAAAAAFSAGYATRLVIAESAMQSSAPKQVIVNSPSEPAPAEAVAFGVFWEAWHLVEQHFMGELPNLQKLSYAAIRGMLAELKDPHTVFVEPRMRQLEKDEHRGRFGGIGAWVYQREDDRRIVLRPQEGGPAARAGICDGDVVVQVDNTIIDVNKITRDEVVSLIRGPVGSKVRLIVRRTGEPADLIFEIVREEITTPSVEWRLLDDRGTNIGYIYISMFTERTNSELENAIRDLKANDARRLVLDLRDNPGGLLESAVAVTNQFLSDGVILIERKRDGSEKVYGVQPGGLATDLPLVVLTNKGSASASEIVAGALHDHGRAKLVGERTYGKGSVQLVFDLSDGSSVHVTVARWMTPNRKPIDGAGIQPDISVPLTEEDRAKGLDPQLNEAVKQF